MPDPHKPLSPRGLWLDRLSRKRSLTETESLELEREVLGAAGKRLPLGLVRDLARRGIKRDMNKYTKPAKD